MAQKENKTNAMRILDRMKIPYVRHAYECKEFVDGLQTADELGLPHEKVYKTLVTAGNSGNYFVFVIPVAEELDLKKAAVSVGEKALSMLPLKDINAVTGYIRGGCTPIGMKKQYVTRIDRSAGKQDLIYISGGRPGLQLQLAPQELLRAANAQYAPLTAPFAHNKKGIKSDEGKNDFGL